MKDNVLEYCLGFARKAKTASRTLASAEPARKYEFLNRLAAGLIADARAILQANEQDVRGAKALGLTAAQIDRLQLSAERLNAAADGVREIAALPELIGRILESSIRPNGLRVDKVSVPLGVILFIYESRPNVTVDAAALAVKSGNAIILRGGKEAAQSNAALYCVISDALSAASLPIDAVQLVATADRDVVGELLKLSEYIDLAIPRGGQSLIERVAREARMPVMKHYQGICHVYVDASADLEMAKRIVINSKCQRPGVCNAAECLLVHHEIVEQFLPDVGRELAQHGLEIRGCERTCRLIPSAKRATEKDYATEYLDLILSVRVIDSLDAAMEHIRRFGSGHTESIITRDLAVARRFVAEVDSSAVMVNASTRFNDGGELGLGAEIGISTDKFHARGPCGLRELTSYKYVVYGDGQVRE
jgi:glutamate-5-semialdehyde dehydrogenase